MAESVVGILLNELSRVLKEEVNLQRGVKKDIESVKEELEAMKAFLRFADAKEDDPRLQSWVRQVRDVAFQMEDVLDEFLLLIADLPYNNCLQRIRSSIKRWKAQHQIGSELQSIKAKVNDVAERPKKYGYSPPPNLYEQGSSSAMASNQEIDQFRKNALFVEESQLIGIDSQKNKLISWLLNDDPNLQVLAIVGMGGLGKTTLAKQIYCDDAMKSKFKNRALVTVSQLLREEELLVDMIHQLFREEMPMPKLPMDHLKERMKEMLQEKRYLIVLDDVWREDHWDQVKLALPRNNCASRVVITTRIAEVARYSSKEFQGMVHNLQPLFETDSWTLFCKKTFQTQSCPSHLEPICRQILDKCGGVPLVILAIGGLLATKDEHNIEAWEMVQRSLNVELEENPSLKMMNKILALSFQDLPYHLKSCYMFLSVFPEDYFIESMRLIRLWISQGFVEQKDGRTSEEVAHSYLDNLLNRSLIQIAKMTHDGRVKCYRIHDFLREAILSKSREQRFVEVISREYTIGQLERARRLSIYHHKGQEYEIKSGVLSRLRCLILFEADDTFNNSDDTSSSSKMSKLPGDGFKLLTVLDMRGAPLHSFPEAISRLLLLRYLSLRDTKVSKVPKSIRNLQRLEILDLKQTFVIELPPDISMLQKLRHLLICHYEYTSDNMGLSDMILKCSVGISASLIHIDGFKLTPAIGDLVSLQKLSFLEAPEDSGLIKVLGNLTQLRQLCLVNLREQHWRDLCSSISKMRNLRSLTLHTAGIFDLQYMSSPPPLLLRLYLSGHLNELPSWMRSLKNLQVLHLMFTRLKKDPSECLKSLPNLTMLMLYEAFDDMWMSLKRYSVHDFESLKLGGVGRSRRMSFFTCATRYVNSFFPDSAGCSFIELPVG